MSAGTVWEKIEITSGRIADAIEDLVKEGNVRRIRVRQRERTIAEFPLTVGVVGTLLAPQLALLGVVVAMLAQCSIEIQYRGAPNHPA